MGKHFRPLFIREKGTNWGFLEEFGNVRNWQANYGRRQQVRLLIDGLGRTSQDSLASYLNKVEFRALSKCESNFIRWEACQVL